MSKSVDRKLWTKVTASWLKDAVDAAGGQSKIAHVADVSRQAINNIVNGKSTPTNDTLDLLLKAIGKGRKDVPYDGAELELSLRPRHAVPVLNIRGFDGGGRLAAKSLSIGSPSQSRLFDEPWLRSSFGDPTSLRLVTIRGDGQAPLLEDGDELFVDVSDKQHIDGVAVVLFVDHLMVKCVQFAGPVVYLSNANPLYPPVAIDLRDKGTDFRIIGRVVWRSGKVR